MKMKKLFILGFIAINSWGFNKDYIQCMSDRNMVYSCMEARYHFEQMIKMGVVKQEKAERIMQRTYGPLHCKEKAIAYLKCNDKYGKVFDF